MKVTKSYLKQVIQEQLSEEADEPMDDAEVELYREAIQNVNDGIGKAQAGIRKLWRARIIDAKKKAEYMKATSALFELRDSLQKELKSLLPQQTYKGGGSGRMGIDRGTPHFDSSDEYDGSY